ncbi:MAG: DUF2961 domain-containing protein [Planctomycetes bacterium]|nr:DUF2961 domain-containing protein [Planctomycetota bacterium]
MFTLIALTVVVFADPPGPGDPHCLIDLRHLARAPVGERFIIDTLSGKDMAEPKGGEFVIANLSGPGVVDHMICVKVGTLTIYVDGKEVLSANPMKAWKKVYPAPKASKRGELPFAYPFVQVAGPFAECALPIPFKERLLVTSTKKSAGIWISGRRLLAPPEVVFSTAADSPYMKSLKSIDPSFSKPVDFLPGYPNARTMKVERHCRASEKATLAEVAGPGEIVGMRLRILPAALELLRYQVIEITIDGAPSVRMPLVDFLGVSHPWPHAWMPRAGDQAVGIHHPRFRSGAERDPAVSGYFKLPIPFEKSLRIAIRNRSDKLPVTVYGKLIVAPLPKGGAKPYRLCGTSRRLGLPEEGEADLFEFPGAGRLVGLSMFTTGHKHDSQWRKIRVELRGEKGTIACGPGLLPLAMGGLSGNIVFGAFTWNHNSLERTGRCGAARHFWIDPIPVAKGDRLCYVAEGKGGPTRAEVGVLWYQPFDARPYSAPAVPDDVEVLPPVVHGQPGRPEPGGWMVEAEDLAASAETTSGVAKAETTGAKDAFASAGAYLGWNAGRPGDVCDLLVAMPDSRYVRLWIHRLTFPCGGIFKIGLAPLHDVSPELTLKKGSDSFFDRVIGRATAPASVDCYGIWPWRQAYRFDMPITLNPAPGGRGRIRFTCLTKFRGSRGYLLAIDQLGMDPAPATPEGWREIEDAVVSRCDVDATADLMEFGREDFFGWGGREVIVKGQGAVEVTLLQPVAGPSFGAIELRGLVEEGKWTAQVEGAETKAISSSKKPCVWRLPLPRPVTGPVVLTLTLRCRSQGGRLLADAWRPAAQGP